MSPFAVGVAAAERRWTPARLRRTLAQAPALSHDQRRQLWKGYVLKTRLRQAQAGL